jgi:hypothetical protein
MSPLAGATTTVCMRTHLDIKLKDKAWHGEFIDLSLLLKSARELVNEPNLESDLAMKGGVLAVVSKKINTIRNI